MPDLAFSLTDAADGSPSLTAGTDTTMTLAVTNQSGADLSLPAGAAAAQLLLPLPDWIFTAAEIGAMAPSGPAGWAGSAEPGQSAVVFTCSSAATWRQGETLTFTIGQVRTDATAGPAQLSGVTLQLDAGDARYSDPGSLTVKAPSPAGPQPLPLPLAATLSVGGVVYCSTAADPLVNTLDLTLKNTSTAGAICTAGELAGSPQVMISFVYGTTAGALAPAGGWSGPTPPLDSAWGIKATLPVAETDWTSTSPNPSDETPTWILKPGAGNNAVLGAAGGDTANLTVSFGGIISFNEPGHTQVIVLCTGFMRDPHTPYEDLVLVLDLDKASPPATRGIVAFGSPDPPVIEVTKPGTDLALTLQWTMYGGVKKALLTTSAPSVTPQTFDYPRAAMLEPGRCTLNVPAPAGGGPVFVTLQAYAGGGPVAPGAFGTFLNQAQYTAFVQAMYVTDPAGAVYPVRRYGTTLWMTADYAYVPSGEADSSVPPGSLDGPAGRYYTWEAARNNAPQGWVLPDDDDWKALASGRDWPALVYGKPGDRGFDAVLGGRYDPDGDPQNPGLGSIGYYWTAAAQIPMQLLGPPPPLIQRLDSGVSAATQIAVRYVRRL